MSSIQPFLRSLNHKNSHVRAKAARALGKIGTEAAITALLDALNHEDLNGSSVGRLGIRANRLGIRHYWAN
jgi:HEAT repeat protein